MRTPKLLVSVLVLTLVLAIGQWASAVPETIQAGQKASGKAPAKAPDGADWPELRGPRRDGTSPEKNLPEKWSPQGENLLWTAPYGGISTPIVLGDRVYYTAQAGAGPTRQEKLLCLDANTGKLLWERAINLYHSDVPPHRVAWASPAADTETGNVYVFAANGQLLAYSRDGKPLWTRYVTEEFGLITTHGGRTVSPAIDGGAIFVSGVTFGWGEHAGGGNRVFAFDKKTGDLIWIARPGGRPTDTTYAPPIIEDIAGKRLFIDGLSDGGTHALLANTGQVVWSFPVSKRGLNTGAILLGSDVLITHSEENLDTNEMGFMARVDGAATGTLAAKDVRWLTHGFQGGFSSPVTDGKIIYQVDNGALMGAFDAATGKELWTKKLGTVHKANTVLADGKIYVGTESGKFFILRPSAGGCEILSEVVLGNPADPDAVIGGAALSRGRIYFASKTTLYAIGRKGSRVPAWKPAPPAPKPVAREGAAAFVQVLPAEVILKPGDTAKFRARLFDKDGNFLRDATPTWKLGKSGNTPVLEGTVAADGTYTAPAALKGQAGAVEATVEGVTGAARVRVIPPLPWSDDFTSTALGTLPAWWMNATGKYAVKEIEGNKVLTKLADNTFSFIKRARVYAGPVGWSDYTVECDVRLAQRGRQMGDGGVSAQGYQLVLFSAHDRVELQSWQPETERTKTAAFAIQANTWYRLKLRVENLPDGKVRARGKVWPAAEPEPDAWTIDRTDAAGYGIKHGSPGIYGDAVAEVYFDNFKVVANK